MSKIKKAIDTLEALYKFKHDLSPEQEDAILFAQEVLREKLERENGCEYCQNERRQLVSIMCVGGGKPKYYNPAVSHHFCPMCGKRLEGDGEVNT